MASNHWRTAEAPLGALVGTIVFAGLVAGTVVGVGPFFLSEWHMRAPLFGFGPLRWAGVALFLAAIPVFVDFLTRFVLQGRGTPAPFAPPRRLVIGGPFQYVRNPGYLAAVTMIVGEGLLFGSAGVLIYAALVALAFHLFVVFYEEPTLRTTFGSEYESYARAVPRWIPRLTPALWRTPSPGLG
jgi:protein-S-isoprenylcysteine O-methyltransferase Ste14